MYLWAMAGLYIHIPFCRHKCHYCNFYSLASTKNFGRLVDALKLEMGQRSSELSEPLDSVYLGGGTPSLLDEKQLMEVMQTVFSHFTVKKDAEITLEANPEDINPHQLEIFKKNHINRLSIGIQSFFDNELQYLNRIHSAKTAIDAVKLAKDKGFHNISIDLIYGLPNATTESWKKNLEQALKLNVPHLSCYALTIEPNTALARFIEKGRMKNVSDELFEHQFELLIEKTKELGYKQYEISNFCLDSYYAIHNTNYWFGEKYLGIGPSAHSYDGETRQWNVAHLKNYIDSVNSGKVLTEYESLSAISKYNEYIMTRLRTFWGVSISEIQNMFGDEIKDHFMFSISKYINSGHLNKSGDTILLTKKGKFVSDGIIADLFYDEN